MHTSHETGSASSEDNSVEYEVKYQFMTVKAIRGREAATKTKWQNQGWEFVEQAPGALRSELTFRKVKPKGFGAYVAQGYAAFRGLQPKTQKVVLGGVGALVGVLLLWGMVAAAFGGDDEATAASEPPPAQSANSEATTEPTQEPVEEPTEDLTEDPEASETLEVEPYSYEGPEYEVVVVDNNVGPAKLSQFWALASPGFNFSKEDYKEQVRLIIEDIAHEQGTASFMAQIVSNREIAEAEAPSTQKAFIAEHGDAYFINTIPKLEVKGWVASYTGGFDYNTGKASDAPEAFEVIWRPYATSEVENWQPVVDTSPDADVDADADAEVETEDETSASPTPKPKPKPNALQERTAIDFLANAWEAKFTYGGDVNDLLGLLDVVKNRDGSYYIEVTAEVENAYGNQFDTVVRGTVAGTDASPRIRQSTIDTPEGGTIGYYE
jgi:hypothetical protein